MKKLFLILTFSVSFFLIEENCKAQTLRLDSIGGFPDTVQNNQVVPMDIWFTVTGTNFTGDIAILMNSTQHDSLPDTLYYSQLDTISGNGTLDTLHITYTFKAADLDGGDNIVVVWPSSIQGVVDPDSLQFNLVLRNVGLEENENSQVVQLFPNPSHDIINIHISHPEKVEQVRVFDVLGNELLSLPGMTEKFSTGFLSSGVYFVGVRNRDQTMVVRKFFRE